MPEAYAHHWYITLMETNLALQKYVLGRHVCVHVHCVCVILVCACLHLHVCQLYTFKNGYHNGYEEPGCTTIGLQGWEVDLGREQGRDPPIPLHLLWHRPDMRVLRKAGRF